jgi:membrane protease YdiL (CAAX protease family)
MQFLVDPSRLELGVASILFLVVLCLLLPLAAIQQNRQLATDDRLRQTVSRQRIYVSALVTHAVLLALALWVVREQDINLLPAYRPAAAHFLIASAALALGLILVMDRFRLKDAVAEERARMIAPRTPREHATFVAVAISAGISEETVYRGVLFLLLASVLEFWWLAAIVQAIAFGIAHSFQGWKSSSLAALIAVRDQIVVGLTGTLIYAIVIHALHDLVAGAVIALRARREEAAAGAALAPY